MSNESGKIWKEAIMISVKISTLAHALSEKRGKQGKQHVA
jgi:hypothetical protein